MEAWRKELYLAHHGIKGQKWGKRNGPPYPLKPFMRSFSERMSARRQKRLRRSIYKKRHYDEVLKKGTVLSTLSYDPNRTNGAEMFYATHKKLDKRQYNALFNSPIPKTIYDEQGNSLGTGTFLKYKINNKLTSDMRGASEDSGAKSFRSLYKNDKDFLYSQLGITQGVLDGSADDKTMNNYYNRTIEPILSAIVEEMRRKFLTKTARSQRQPVMFFRFLG